MDAVETIDKGGTMLDQYGNEVPTDLIIPSNEVYDEEEYATIMNATWYQVDIFIAMSCEEIGLDLAEQGTEFEDAGIEITDDTEILFIQDILHRYDDGGLGFYHA